MFISELSLATFSLLIRTDHVIWNLSYPLSTKRSNEVKSQKGYQPCHSMKWLSSFWLALVLGMYLYFLSLSYHMYAHYPSYRNFKRAHNFSSDGLFVNPGKAAADGIGVSDNRVVVAGGRISIIFISNSCVAACNLFIPGITGSSIHINRVKKIGIWPLNEEFDALTAYFGAVYSISQFYSSFFGDILTFQMQKEITSSSNHSGPSCMCLLTFSSYCRSLIEIT